MRIVDGTRDFAEHFDTVAKVAAEAIHLLGQRAALDQFHAKEMVAVMIADIEIGMMWGWSNRAVASASL